MSDSFFDFEPSEEDAIPIIDHDSVPDILHRWLTYESDTQNAFLVGEDLEIDLTEVIGSDEAVFLILYLCSMFDIDAELTFPTGGGIIYDQGDDECEW